MRRLQCSADGVRSMPWFDTQAEQTRYQLSPTAVERTEATSAGADAAEAASF
jgi:hypothetical protein